MRMRRAFFARHVKLENFLPWKTISRSLRNYFVNKDNICKFFFLLSANQSETQTKKNIQFTFNVLEIRYSNSASKRVGWPLVILCSLFYGGECVKIYHTMVLSDKYKFSMYLMKINTPSTSVWSVFVHNNIITKTSVKGFTCTGGPLIYFYSLFVYNENLI